MKLSVMAALNVIVEPPMFLRVAVCAGLVVPTFWAAKVSEVGVSWTAVVTVSVPGT